MATVSTGIYLYYYSKPWFHLRYNRSKPKQSDRVKPTKEESSDSEVDEEYGTVRVTSREETRSAEVIDNPDQEDLNTNLENEVISNNEMETSDNVTSTGAQSDDIVISDCEEFQEANSNLEEWTPVKEKDRRRYKGGLDIKDGDKIRYKSEDDDEWKEAIVICRAGKADGKNMNEFNIELSEDKSKHHLHLDKFNVQKSKSEVSSIMYIEESYSHTFVVNVPKERYKDPLIKEAMGIEMDYWKKYNVFTEVNDHHQKTLSTRWVVTQKAHNKYKARLVERGFEELDVNHVDSPTGDKCSLRIMLALSKANNWKVESIDIKAAFLQSQELDRIVFIKPPKELKRTGIIWRLNKPAYGLCDSSRNWYISLKEFLISTGCTCCTYDKALFYYRVDNKICGILLLHVDDILLSGNMKFRKEVFSNILKKYETSSHEKDSFKYIGMNISQSDKFIQLDQYDYADFVETVQIDPVRLMDKTQSLNNEEKTEYLSLLGKLSWLSYITRPDLKFDVYEYSKFNKSPTIQNLADLNGIVSKLNKKKCLRFPKLNLKEPLTLVVYSDASFANLDNKVNSGRGYVIFLVSEENACVLTWNSNKVSRVVSSVLESETLALRDAMRHAEWLRTIIINLLYGDCDENVISIICYIDSEQLWNTLHSNKFCANHALRRDIEIIREYLTRGAVSEVTWIPNELMLADPLTKRGADCRKLDVVLNTGRHSKVR